uniref:Uncharacterized protein n=1 Tax=Anguilla anguilla TaxID=7936 RepID=A0A0E9R585_ANGAN
MLKYCQIYCEEDLLTMLNTMLKREPHKPFLFS